MAWDQLSSKVKLSFILIVTGFVAATAGCMFMTGSIVAGHEIRRPDAQQTHVDTVVLYDHQGVNTFPASKALAIIGFLLLAISVVLLLVYTHIEEVFGNLIIKIVALATAIIGGIFYLAAAACTLAWASAKVDFSYQGAVGIIGSMLAIVGGVFLVLEIVLGRRSDGESEHRNEPPKQPDI